MSSPHDSRDALVDAYVRHAVRSVLFPRQLGGRSPQRTRGREERDETPVDGLPFQVGQYHAHVLRYASWSDEQLREEKKKLKKYLKTHRRDAVKQEQGPEDDHETPPLAGAVAIAMEAYALLKLFLRERASVDAATREDENKASRRLLHAQLSLFAVYFEKTHGRGIEHESDAVHVRTAYQAMLQTQSNEYT